MGLNLPFQPDCNDLHMAHSQLVDNGREFTGLMAFSTAYICKVAPLQVTPELDLPSTYKWGCYAHGWSILVLPDHC